ncbi:MAG: hypothetical protein OXG47_08610 [bacterium]|nr:hypothetical protein [bacterium]MCY3924061.1 hypothetical protein [bacterium]
MTAAGALVSVAVAVWAALGVYVSATDLRRGIIPGRWVWRAGWAVAALLGAACWLLGDPLRLAWAFAAAAGVGLGFEVIYRVSPEGVGFGDVRLIILNSLLVAWWGPQWAIWALLAGTLAALPQAVASILRHGGKGHVRWGPYLVLGAAGVLAWRLAAHGPVG